MALNSGAAATTITDFLKHTVVAFNAYSDNSFTLGILKGGQLNGNVVSAFVSNQAAPDLANAAHWNKIEGAFHLETGTTYGFSLPGTIAVQCIARNTLGDDAVLPNFTIEAAGKP